MKIVEFNGLPGVGKSTLSDRFIKQLLKKNILIADLKDVVFKNQKNSFENYLYIIKKICSLKSIKFNIAVLRFTKDYKLSKQNVVYALRLIKLYNKLIDIIDEDEFDYIVLDEGILQYVTSIPHDNLIEKNKNFYNVCNIIKKNFKDFLYIDCYLKKDELFSRIRKRNNTINRFDTLPEDQLENILIVKQKNINILRECLNYPNNIYIDMELNIEENVNKLLKYL